MTIHTRSHAFTAILTVTAAFALEALGCDQTTVKPEPPASAASQGVAPPPPPARATEISMLYSSEKKEWIEAAAATFQKAHPEIKLTLTAMGSLDAAQAIVDGKEKPTLFSPADSLVENLVASDWKSAGRPDLFVTSGEDAPQPLVITPLVYVVWEDRAAALLKASGGTIG